MNRKGLQAIRGISAIVILFGAMLICFLWSGLYHIVQSERQLEITNAYKDTANYVRMFEEHTVRTIKGLDQITLFLKYQVEKYGWNFDIHRLEIEDRFAGQPYVLLAVVDENGNMKASNQDPFVFSNTGDREHFLVHREFDSGKVYISKPVLGRATGKLAIQLTRRINKPDGSFGGVAAVSVDPYYFAQFYKQVDLGKDSSIALIGRDGFVRVRQDGKETGVGQDFSKSVVLEKVLDSFEGNYTTLSMVDGIRRYYSYRALNEYPLIVAVGESEAAVLLALNERVTSYYWAGGALSLFVVLFVVVLLIGGARREQAEETLREQEANFFGFFNTIEDFLFVLDAQGQILHVNQTVLSRLEYPMEELTGQSVLMVHPEQRQAEAGRIVENMLDGAAESCLIPLISKSGELIPVETRVTSGTWNGKTALFGISKDISALKVSEEKLAKVFEATSSLMAISTQEEGIILDVNHAFLSAFGFERREVVGKRSVDLHIFEHMDFRDEIFQQLQRDGSVRNLEVQLRTKDGRPLFGLFSAEIAEVAAYRLLITTVNDVTELKQAEQKLRESEERFTLSMEATRDGLWDWNLLTDSCYFSPGYFHMLGYEDGAFPKEINSWTALLHPEDREAALKANEDCREGRCQSFEVEFRLKNKQEAWQWILSRGKSVVFDGYGRALRMVGTHVDITERKQTEEALRRSSEIQADPTGERRFLVVGRKGLRSGF